MNKSLVDKAKGVQFGRMHDMGNEDEMELAIAWLKGEITAVQAAVALFGEEKGRSRAGNVVYHFAKHLKQAYIKGIIRIEK